MILISLRSSLLFLILARKIFVNTFSYDLIFLIPWKWFHWQKLQGMMSQTFYFPYFYWLFNLRLIRTLEILPINWTFVKFWVLTNVPWPSGSFPFKILHPYDIGECKKMKSIFQIHDISNEWRLLVQVIVLFVHVPGKLSMWPYVFKVQNMFKVNNKDTCIHISKGSNGGQAALCIFYCES